MHIVFDKETLAKIDEKITQSRSLLLLQPYHNNKERDHRCHIIKDEVCWCANCRRSQPWKNKICEQCGKRTRHALRGKRKERNDRLEAEGKLKRYE